MTIAKSIVLTGMWVLVGYLVKRVKWPIATHETQTVWLASDMLYRD